jgi:putative ABC transport system permease protein
VTFVAVGVAAGESPQAVRDRLQQRLPETLVFTRAQLHDMELRYFQKRTPVGVVCGMGTLLAALIGAGIVGVTLYSSVIDRLREFGTLKALGASREDLLRLLGAQALLFSAVGYPLGLLGFALVRHLSGPSVTMPAPYWLLASVAAATVIVCGAASAIAVRRVLQVEPAIVFRG